MIYRLRQWFLLAALLHGSAAGLSGSMALKSVETHYYPATEFIRLAEYLTGEPAERPEVVARTHPEERAGLYFRVILEESASALPQGVVAELSILMVDSPEPAVFRLHLPSTTGRTRVLLLGLTGADWPEAPETPHPTAWKVRLLSQEGESLAEWPSFLWGSR